METHRVSIRCYNCHHVPGGTVSDYGANAALVPKRFTVPKGTTVQKFLQEMTCKNCGCEGFMWLN
jgi:hypothetical protein